MKKLLLAMVCLMMLVGCGAQETVKEEENVMGGVQIANPFRDYATLEEAFVGAGLEMNLPETVGTYTINDFRAMPEKMLEVIYVDGDNDIKVRKTEGVEDNSGYFGANELVEEVQSYNGLELNIKSNEDVIYVVTWNVDGYSYSLTAHAGISTEDVHTLVDSIHA